MKSWQSLKPVLINSLTDAFNEASFKQMLEFWCQKNLDFLVADRIPFPQKVYEVVNTATREGWLDRLATGAREANASHTGLQEVTSDVLDGIVFFGAIFYHPPDSQHESVARGEIDIDGINRDKLVKTLVACATMNSRERRDDVVRDLPLYIQGNIERRTNLYDDVNNIVRTCMEYNDGMSKLVATIKKREGKSKCMKNLEMLLQK